MSRKWWRKISQVWDCSRDTCT